MPLPAGPPCSGAPPAACVAMRLQRCLSHNPPAVSLSETGWVGHCRGTPGTAHSITPAGAPGRMPLPAGPPCSGAPPAACVAMRLQRCLSHNPPEVSLSEGAARNACRCDAVGCARGASAVPHPPSLTEGHCRRVVGQAALQAHCYAGRRRGAAAGGSGRQRHDQGAPAGVMLWAVPGVPLQCPTHPASLRDTAGGLWDRQRCKRIATQAAGGAPLQGGPAGSGMTRGRLPV